MMESPIFRRPFADRESIDFPPSPETSQMAHAIDPGRPRDAFWAGSDDFRVPARERFPDFSGNGDIV